MPVVNVPDSPMLGKKVSYDGDRRRAEFDGLVGVVEKVNFNPVTRSYTWGVKFNQFDKLTYAASWAWVVEPPYEPIAKPSLYDGPHGKALEAIDKELQTLMARKAELEAARKVLEGL